MAPGAPRADQSGRVAKVSSVCAYCYLPVMVRVCDVTIFITTAVTKSSNGSKEVQESSTIELSPDAKASVEGLPAKRDVRREQPGRSEALGVAVTQAGRRWPGPCARSREAWRGSGVRSATAPCRSQTKRGASSGSQQYSSRKKGREGFPGQS